MMKQQNFTISALCLVMLLPVMTKAQPGIIDTSSKWTWMSGKNGTGRYQIDNEQLGTKGTPYKMVAPTGLGNYPGTKDNTIYWKDTAGMLYIFGGHFNGQNSFNQVWRINPKDSTWTWLHGQSGYASTAVKGKLAGAPGVPHPDNMPESRYSSSFAADKTGCVWVFGGYDNSTIKTKRNDFWFYSPYDNEWTYFGGSVEREKTVAGVYGTKGKTDATNWPGARGNGSGAAWVDDETGKFYMFSGQGVAKDNTKDGYLTDFWVFDMKSHEWTWMAGGDSITTTLVAEYGTKGIASDANFPQPRSNAATWKDKDGNFWMFGGQTIVKDITYRLNDLWKYDPKAGNWTWMGGDKIGSPNYESTLPSGNYITKGVYGTPGVPSANNIPGGRSLPGCAVDDAGNFWLFGGFGLVDSPMVASRQNDLWKYNPGTNEWTWMGGSKIGSTVNQGTPGTYLPNWQQGGQPGGRDRAALWFDDNGNIWMHAGYGGGLPNEPAQRSDLWMLQAVRPPMPPGIIDTTSEWTWMDGKNGTGRYDIDLEKMGTKGTPYKIASPTARGAAYPGTKGMPVYWKDTLNQFYIFGGHYNQQNTFNSVWRFRPEDSTWTWLHGQAGYASSAVKGKLAAAPGVPHPDNMPESRYNASFAVDKAGCVWVFGGRDNSTIGTKRNDLWYYNPYDNEWTYFGGSVERKKTVAGVYGTKGKADATNWPGSRGSGNAATWIDDETGKFYMFSGTGVAKDDAQDGYLTDFWVFDMKSHEWTWIAGGDSITTTVVAEYGTKGVASGANFPQPRSWPSTWKDKEGNFWMFGGRTIIQGTNYRLNDLWKYDPKAGNWTWMGGDKISSPNYQAAPTHYATKGIYGTRGVPSTNNIPGGRSSGATWVDTDGNLWLFGGAGLVETPQYVTSQNDLWKYNPYTNEWTWINGSKEGVQIPQGTPGNYLPGWQKGGQPGGRYNSAAWIADNGDVWVYSGIGGGTLNEPAFRSDLWLLEAVPRPMMIGIDVTGVNPTQATYCIGDEVEVEYHAAGAYNSGNTFTVQLSDQNGDFTNPVDIGSISSAATTGTITTTVPNVTEDNGYEIRIVSSDPVVTGASPGNAFRISAKPAIAPKADPKTVICSGEEITLYGHQPKITGITYTWDQGIQDADPFKPTQTSTYTVKAENEYGCFRTDTIHVVVNPIPVVTATAQPEEVCAGEETTITQGGNAATYSWDKSLTSGDPFVPTVTQTYVVTGTSAEGCEDKDSVTVVVNPLPVITADASPSNNLCEGDDVTLAGNGAVIYNWNHNITDNQAFTPNQTETYTVVGTDANGCMDSTDITVTVRDTAIIAISDTICSGDVYTLGSQDLSKPGTYTEVFVAGNGCDSTVHLTLAVNRIDLSLSQGGNTLKSVEPDTTATYQWVDCNNNNQPIPGATGSSYTNEEGGDFAVIITKGDCTDTSVCYHLVGTPGGINGIDFSNQVTLYPNPNHGQMTVNSGNALNNATVRVINIIGQTVMTQAHVSGNSFKIDIHQYAAGVYYVEIREDASIARLKFTKE